MTDLLPAYARSLGIEVADASGESPLLRIDFTSDVEGRVGALHGGAIAGLLETAAYAALRTALAHEGRDPPIKPITITVEYLSAGRPRTSYAQGRIVRLGRRNANIAVEAWQDDRARPIASAVLNVLVADAP